MRSSTIIMIAVAAVFGLLAVFVAQSWLNSQAEARLKSLEAQKVKPTATQSLVVAGRALRFGNELSPSVLRILPPERSLRFIAAWFSPISAPSLKPSAHRAISLPAS